MNAAARSNPRRRQRNSSDDSVAIRQPVKRRKRSALTTETFQPPEATGPNGISAQHQPQALATESPAKVEHAGEEELADETKLAFRGKSARRHDEASLARRLTTSEILVST